MVRKRSPVQARWKLGNRFKTFWPVGQVVKTPPFHGGNTGSNPVRVTTFGGLAQLGEHLPYKQGSAVRSRHPPPYIFKMSEGSEVAKRGGL